ncbi:hypothetical protein DSO57_1029641 [Entomophthora muscae]|uniref:Uncharacterized protein n=1 Tax=Entomophthora muscae TaxID=34485 RepID=A0ACC2RFV8_9FUNG|nr:hypothetical protein DSO57_1029641 [Entomophthora muscae]
MKFIYLVASAVTSINNIRCTFDYRPHDQANRNLNCFAKPPIEVHMRPAKPTSVIYFYDSGLMQCLKRALHYSPTACIPFPTMEDCVEACVDQTLVSTRVGFDSK